MEYFNYTNQLEPNYDAERRRFSRVGLAFFAFVVISFAVAFLLQSLYFILVPNAGSLPYPGWMNWTVSIVSLYGVAAPVTYLILRTVPASTPTGRRLRPKSFFLFTFIAFALMIAGSILGTIVNTWVTGISGNVQGSEISEALASSDFWISVLYTGILAPILEELFFRKFLIDRIHGSGDLVCILTSGIFFGLFHGNIDQFFYATLIGCLFAYIYINTGNVYYCMGIHAIINLFGGLIPTAIDRLITRLNPGEGVTTLLALLTTLPIYAFALVGLILLILYFSRLRSTLQLGTLPRGSRFSVVTGNTGVILFTLACLAQFLLVILL